MPLTLIWNLKPHCYGGRSACERQIFHSPSSADWNNQAFELQPKEAVK
jgi:hypothetical protein